MLVTFEVDMVEVRTLVKVAAGEVKRARSRDHEPPRPRPL